MCPALFRLVQNKEVWCTLKIHIFNNGFIRWQFVVSVLRIIRFEVELLWMLWLPFCLCFISGPFCRYFACPPTCDLTFHSVRFCLSFYSRQEICGFYCCWHFVPCWWVVIWKAMPLHCGRQMPELIVCQWQSFSLEIKCKISFLILFECIPFPATPPDVGDTVSNLNNMASITGAQIGNYLDLLTRYNTGSTASFTVVLWTGPSGMAKAEDNTYRQTPFGRTQFPNGVYYTGCFTIHFETTSLWICEDSSFLTDTKIPVLKTTFDALKSTTLGISAEWKNYWMTVNCMVSTVYVSCLMSPIPLNDNDILYGVWPHSGCCGRLKCPLEALMYGLRWMRMKGTFLEMCLREEMNSGQR